MNALMHDPGLKEAAIARDKARLQGVWNFLTGRRKVQLVIDGDHYTSRFNNGDVYEGTFQLDPTKKPKTMDMTITEGPEKHKGLVSHCVYALDGDHLVWCPNEPGVEERPNAIPGTDSQKYLCVVFKRQS